MHKPNPNLACLLSLLWTFASSLALATDGGLNFKEHLEKANNYINAYRHFEAAEELNEAARLGGAKHPSLYIRLGTLYYGLGLVSEAIAEGEKAVNLEPSSKWFRYDLAKFYFVDKQYLKAEEQFMGLLKLDPGFTLGYYYLSELYFRNKEYDMAWLSYQRARALGHQGKLLEAKLAPHTGKPTEDFEKLSKGNMIFRFIKLSSEKQAKEILEELDKGKLFEMLELQLKKEDIGEVAFGIMSIDELPVAVADTQRNRQPYALPQVVQTGADYRVLQRIAPFDPLAWRTTLGAASPAVKDGRGKFAAPADAPAKSQLDNAKRSSSPPTITVTAEKDNSTEAGQIADEKDKEALATQLAAYHALENWKNAWQSADVGKYLAAYSSRYTPPDNLDLATWKKKRTASLTHPKFINVKIKGPVVEILTDNQLLITFTQKYESDSFQDTVIKVLTMERENGSWKISNERSAE